MSDRSGIEWTDASWNPVTGCTEVSAGCDRCYAKTLAERFRGTSGHYYENGFDFRLRPEKLDQPLRWRRPRRIFVNSMSDLFHDSVPDEYIARVFAVMSYAYRHTFQLLTKRHARMRSLLSSPRFVDLFDREFCKIPDWNDRYPALDFARPGHVYHLADGPLSNVHMGVSAENQQWADIRIPALRETPAAVRWISAEPLLGPIDLSRWITRDGYMREYSGHHTMCAVGSSGGCFVPWCDCPCHYEPVDRLHWVVVGGESGLGARPMHPDWARNLRNQCQIAGVPFLFKQWGEYRPAIPGVDTWKHITTVAALPDVPMTPGLDVGITEMRRVGKRRAGRELDGRTWDEYPRQTL